VLQYSAVAKLNSDTRRAHKVALSDETLVLHLKTTIYDVSPVNRLQVVGRAHAGGEVGSGSIDQGIVFHRLTLLLGSRSRLLLLRYD